MKKIYNSKKIENLEKNRSDDLIRCDKNKGYEQCVIVSVYVLTEQIAELR